MFKSKLEQEVATRLGKGWGYETVQVEYTLEKVYLGDFTKDDVIVEVKGFFRPGDQAKYLAVRDSCVENGYTFVFILSHPDKPVRRKAKLTMAEWCEKHGIPWYSLDQIKELKKC